MKYSEKPIPLYTTAFSLKQLAALAFLFITVASYAQSSLEIRFQPDSSVFSYQINSNPVEVHTVVLQNIALVNVGDDSLKVEKLSITALKDAQEIQKTTLHSEKLSSYAERLFSIQEAGKLEFLEAKLQCRAYLNGISFCESRQMGKNQAIVITNVPLLFEDLPDHIRVEAHAIDGSGKKIVSHAEIIVDQYISNNTYDFPLKGSWSAFGAPSLNSHHRWIGIQEFSFDFIQMDKKGSSYKRDGSRFHHYYAYNQPIYAIGDGKVVSVMNTIEESDVLLQKGDDEEQWKKVKALQSELMEKGFEFVLGNHVIIEHANNEYSYYMHLKTGSIPLKVGDIVQKGQKIGKLGQSGMSSEPHLHFQLSNSPDILTSRCLPIRFDNIGDDSWNILYGEIIQTE